MQNVRPLVELLEELRTRAGNLQSYAEASESTIGDYKMALDQISEAADAINEQNYQLAREKYIAAAVRLGVVQAQKRADEEWEQVFNIFWRESFGGEGSSIKTATRI